MNSAYAPFADLIQVKERMKKRELDGLREEVQERLAMVAQWILDNPNADIFEDFDESVYDKLYNHGQRAYDLQESIST